MDLADLVKRFRTALIVAGAAVVAAIVLYAALISPQSSKLSTLHNRETQLQSQLSQLQAQISTLKHDKAQMGANCASLSTALTEIPGTPSVDDFLQQVTKLAVASGDPNTPTFGEQTTGTPSGGVTPITVSLTLQGTYGQMSAFLKGLDSFPRLFTVNNVAVTGGPIANGGGSINPGTGGYSLTLAGDIYYGSAESNPCSTTTTTTPGG